MNRQDRPEQPPIATLSSRIVYRNRWMTVRQDAIARADGSEGIYGVVCKPDFSLIIPYHEGAFWLVDQYRYPVQMRSLEFPQGSWEHEPNTAPERVAAAELQEETGWIAARMQHLGRVTTAPGYSTQGMHVFLAQELTAGTQQLSAEERDLVCVRVGIGEFSALVSAGRIQDAGTLAAYALLSIHAPALLATTRGSP